MKNFPRYFMSILSCFMIITAIFMGSYTISSLLFKKHPYMGFGYVLCWILITLGDYPKLLPTGLKKNIL